MLELLYYEIQKLSTKTYHHIGQMTQYHNIMSPLRVSLGTPFYFSVLGLSNEYSFKMPE